MIITLLTSSKTWYTKYCHDLAEYLGSLGHVVHVGYQAHEIATGDMAFFLSFPSIVTADHLLKNKNNLVVHASDLPQGRGWSPWVWQILEGKNTIPVCLLEAGLDVDSGDIYLKEYMHLDGRELLREIREKLANLINNMVIEFVKSYPTILESKSMQKGEPSYYPKRTANDSELDINKTIKDQFNLLRVVDNDSYPAYFNINGVKYILKIDKGSQ